MEIAHSWKDRPGHFLRANKKIKRCIIKNIDIKDTQVLGLWVKFRVNGKKKKKKVDPMELAIMEVAWWNNDVASEDDEDDSIEPPTDPLPFWDVPNLETIAPNKKEAIDFRISSINNILDLWGKKIK